MSRFDIKSNKKISFICNDAGAANIIISWIEKKNTNNFSFYFTGPAKKICKIRVPEIKQESSLIKCINNSDFIVTGTGWQSNLEYDAIRIGKLKNKKIFSVIDHWTNYKARFTRNKKILLPNEIWVTDRYAFKKASKIFLNTRVCLKDNNYLKDLVKKINTYKSRINNKYQKHYLYVLEPMRSNWGHNIRGEFQALDYFCKYLVQLKTEEKALIHLRLHPSENSGKYNSWVTKKRNKGFQIKIDNNKQIVKSIVNADVVVGCQTFPMIIALSAGKRVLCSLPPWAPKCQIPYKKLEFIFDKID